MIGTLKIDDRVFYIYFRQEKNLIRCAVLDKYTRNDAYRLVKGEPLVDVVLSSVSAIERYANDSYVMEAITKSTATGAVASLDGREPRIIPRLLELISFAESYSFSKNNIINDTIYFRNIDKVEDFSADDGSIRFEYKKINKIYNWMGITTSSGEIELRDSSFRLSISKDRMKRLKQDEQKKISQYTIKKVTYKDLCEIYDMSWFEDNGIRKKNYVPIMSVKDFEYKVIAKLAEDAKACTDNNRKLLVALDTETTGLNIYNLSNDNKVKDSCVAFSISWEDDVSYGVFMDMEYFSSDITPEYAFSRLKPFLERTKEDARSITVFSENSDLKKMNYFGGSDDQYSLGDKRVIEFSRDAINLVNHNVMFDGKVLYMYGTEPYFDDDTLQMAFTLYPQVVRGNNKLKNLTRRLLHAETPELEDILGKGNEDKYRFLSDLLVAVIYVCADTDFVRLLYKVLKNLLPSNLYNSYKMQDVPMLNILYKSEYYGLNTIQDKVYSLANNVKQDLNIMREFMYDYVGRIVSIEKQRSLIEMKKRSNLYGSDEEYQKDLDSIALCEGNHRYEFEMKASDIREVIYGILKYPVYGFTNGDTNGNNKKPKTDKFVMKKLMSKKRTKDDPGASLGWKLEKDIISSSISEDEYQNLLRSGKKKQASQYVLISADQFNSLKYPLALVLSKYAELNKEYTSYFEPILERNLEGKMFYPYSLARIETRRIMNPGQTMKANLKELIRSYSDDYYLLDFDMSQVEYRIMASLSGHEEIIRKMQDPEKDYHIETAALVWNIPTYRVTKKIRKQTKSIGFGYPYGLSIRSLAERLFGKIDEESIFETSMIMSKWEKSNKPIVDFLESERDKALIEWKISDEMRDYMDAYERDPVYDIKGKLISNEYKLDSQGNKIPVKLGRSTNKLGFYRVYNLSNLDKAKIGSIRRKAGNFPIQSFAAELFRIILIRFYRLCEEYGLKDKIIWHMLIHDELLCSVHKSVHPFLIYKIVKKACMIRIPGHTNYFVGINIGDTWASTKDDSREAPVHFVSRMIKRYDAGEFEEKWIDDPWEFIRPYREQYVKDRIGEVLKQIQPDIDENPINIPLILTKFTNYTVRSYVYDFPQNHEVIDPRSEDPEIMEKYENDKWVSSFESWVIEVYGEGRLAVGTDNKLYKIVMKTDNKRVVELSLDDEEDESEENQESYWSFDEDEYNVSYQLEPEPIDDAYEEFMRGVKLKKNNNAVSLADLLDDTPKYANLVIGREQVIIKLVRRSSIPKCKKYLENLVTQKDGMRVLFKLPFNTERWMLVKKSINFDELNSFVDELNK